MPAPAVYVIAVVGTVGVAIAFKEFIYPHIAPHIDQWKAEFQAARKRRAEAERSAVMAEVALIQRGARKAGHRSGEDDDSGSNHSDEGYGNGTSRASTRPHMKNGLLIRRHSSRLSETKPGDVELDWISGTSTATQMGSQQPCLRLRKNNGRSNESIQPIQNTPFAPTVSTSRTDSGNSSEMKSSISRTTQSHAFLDEVIHAIPYTPLSPIRTPTPTPTHVLYNPSLSSTQSSHSPFSTTVSSPLPEEPLLSQFKADVINTSTSTRSSPQPPSPSLCAADAVNASASTAEPFLQSPPGLKDIAMPPAAPLLAVGVTGTMIPDSSPVRSLPSLVSPPAIPFSSPPSQLLSPPQSNASPYRTPPHVHAIPSLSQSFPLDELIDYEHGVELLSPPSPLSRTDSPFEFAGLSPRPGMADLLFVRSESGEPFTAAPSDDITNSTKSTTYFSVSSPALSTSSVFPPSENGYENDSSPSEMSSTFSSPSVAPSRLGDIGSEAFLSPHDRTRLNRSVSPLSPRSSPSIVVNNLYFEPRRRHQQQQEGRNPGWASMRIPPVAPAFTAPVTTTRPQESDARRPTRNTFEYHEDHTDTQTLSPRNGSRSPWMMERTVNAAATRDYYSDVDSELSDLDFLTMSGQEEGSNLAGAATAGSVRLGPRSVVHTGIDGRGGAGGPGTRDGNESDTSSWSLAGGSE